MLLPNDRVKFRYNRNIVNGTVLKSRNNMTFNASYGKDGEYIASHVPFSNILNFRILKQMRNARPLNYPNNSFFRQLCTIRKGTCDWLNSKHSRAPKITHNEMMNHKARAARLLRKLAINPKNYNLNNIKITFSHKPKSSQPGNKASFRYHWNGSVNSPHDFHIIQYLAAPEGSSIDFKNENREWVIPVSAGKIVGFDTTRGLHKGRNGKASNERAFVQYMIPRRIDGTQEDYVKESMRIQSHRNRMKEMIRPGSSSNDPKRNTIDMAIQRYIKATKRVP